MKLLFDFLPIILFFGTFKYAEGNKDWASVFASEHLGFVVSSGIVGPNEAPVLLATVVVILATLTQVGVMLALRRKIDTMLWVSLVLVVGLGSATVWFHNDTFIKWKPTVLYWVSGAVLAASALIWRKNLIQKLMSEQLTLPVKVWDRLNLAWVVFFTVMGALNLYFAYSFSTDTWVNFKLFGGMGLMLVFVLGQGVYLNKHLGNTATTPASAKPKP